MTSLSIGQSDDRSALLERLVHYRNLTDEVLSASIYQAERRALAGDTAFVAALIDLGLESDPGLSEEMSGVIDDLWSRNSSLMLTVLSGMTAEEQIALGRLSWYRMNEADQAEMQKMLESHIRAGRPPLASVASKLLDVLRQIQKEVKD